jgi:hypothetical protein
MSVDFTRPCWVADRPWCPHRSCGRSGRRHELGASVYELEPGAVGSPLARPSRQLCQTSRIAYRRAHDRTRGFS